MECLENGDVLGFGRSLSAFSSGAQIGVQELDLSKPYHECCERPILCATCMMNGKAVPVGDHYRTCGKFTCNEDGTMTGVGCALWQCAKGKEIGYKDTDMSKPYPECCPHPICSD